MESFFHTQERLTAARKEANTFEEGSDASSSFSSASTAQSWIRRVEAWISNLRRDLEIDSLPAPGLVGDRWLLYSSGDVAICPSTGAITCKLCKMSRCVVRRYYRYFKEPAHRDAINGKSQRAVAGAGPSGV